MKFKYFYPILVSCFLFSCDNHRDQIAEQLPENATDTEAPASEPPPAVEPIADTTAVSGQASAAAQYEAEVIKEDRELR